MITEGRKESLIDKYGNEELIKDYLTHSDIQVRTNYKYADWYLKQYYAIGSEIDRIEDGDEYLTKFDKYSKNLEKKDINQYKTFKELTSTIEEYEGKRKPKVDDSESVKLVDNDELSVVKPLTHQSSCKYGSGTKWCTTHQDSKYFDDYTTKGNLYYIHLKKLNKSEDFYKMAVFVRFQNNTEEWYNAKDDRMSTGEIKLAKLLIKSEVMSLIYNDVEKSLSSRPKVAPGVTSILDTVSAVLYDDERFDEMTMEYDLTSKGGEVYSIDYEGAAGDVEYNGDWNIVDFPFNMSLKDTDGYLSGYMYFSVYMGERIKVDFNVDYGVGAFKSLEDKTFTFGLQYSQFVSDDVLKERIVKVIKMFGEKLFTVQEVISQLTGKKYWRALNRQSSYKFTGNGALTNSFKKYMNELGPEGLGSKIDFLTKAGRIEKNDNGGYSRVGGDVINIGGYLSTFFASLKNAGIIEYVRQGRRFMFKQGPNYKDFIEGTLYRI
jgi:hypothetical protein